jgi:hypothetical protein
MLDVAIYGSKGSSLFLCTLWNGHANVHTHTLYWCAQRIEDKGKENGSYNLGSWYGLWEKLVKLTFIHGIDPAMLPFCF